MGNTEVKRVGYALFMWTPWVVAAVATVILVRGLLGQATLQGELNQAMQGVRDNLRAATDLTSQTAAAMAPLTDTARQIESMNGLLKGTLGDVRTMNGSMERVTAQQDGILAGLGSLNGHTSTVVDSLSVVDRQNKALLGATGQMTSQTRGQAGSIETLSDLTEQAIGHLNAMNRRFRFLRDL